MSWVTFLWLQSIIWLAANFDSTFSSGFDTTDVLVIGGNFSLAGKPAAIGMFDLQTEVWSYKFDPELYLYSENSNGVIWDMSINASCLPNSIYVVGEFDSTSETSQVQYCSSGIWDGIELEKVGQGLCPRGAEQQEMHIQASVVSTTGDLFVGGNFESRVWNGVEFVNAVNLAKYEYGTQQWLPLWSCCGVLQNRGSATQINSLAWDPMLGILYIGGLVNRIGNMEIPPGLATWDTLHGIQAFDFGGLYQEGNVSGQALAIAWEPVTQSLVISGIFARIGSMQCITVAIWNRKAKRWRCLYNEQYGILTVTTMSLQYEKLYIAGWASPSSSWTGQTQYNAPYAIAVMDLSGYIDEVVFETTRKTRSATYETTASRASVHFDSNVQVVYQGGRFASKQTKGHRHGRRLRTYLAVMSASDRNSTVWIPSWHWLPGYVGGNGPILSILAGSGSYEASLFIGGAFNNFGSIIRWTAGVQNGSNVVTIGSSGIVVGLVTSIVQAKLPFPNVFPTPNPTRPPKPEENDSVLIIISCIFSGIILGVGVAIGCYNNRGYTRIGGSDDSDPSVGITLKTLSFEGDGITIDFRSSFDKAMQARHLPSHETLLMVNPKEVVLYKIIGEGSFGRVWSGQWRNNAVAVKEFVFAQAAVAGGSLQRNQIIEEIVGEAGIMACLRHPKILQLYGCSLTMQAIWIVSELCSQGSLRMLLNDKRINLSLVKKISLCLDIADGMHYLHTRSPPLIHRDLKTHNVFVAEPSPGKYVAKIGDWGSARALQLQGSKSATHGVGTACWLAPEVINHARSSKKSDIYAFAIVLWECYTRQEVHESLSAAQIIAKVANEGLRPKIPLTCPVSLSRIMTDCWSQEPGNRPEFDVIVSSISEIYETVRQRTSGTSQDDLSISSSKPVSSKQMKASTMPNSDRSQLPVILEEDRESLSESTEGMRTISSRKL